MSPVSRRDFLKSAALAGLAAGACGRSVPRILSDLRDPEWTPGKPAWLPSTCRACPAACGLLVEMREGRPVKLEGNPDHPVNAGALCARGQAALFDLFDPRRPDGPAVDGRRASWDEALARVRGALEAARGRILLVTGIEDAVAEAAAAAFARRFEAERLVLEPVMYAGWRAGHRAVFGADEVPRYRLDGATFLLAFGAEILETFLSPVEYGRAYADLRRRGGALVVVSARASLTADAADRHHVVRPGTEALVASALVGLVASVRAPGLAHLGSSVEEAAAASGMPAAAIEALARRLLEAEAPFILPGGSGEAAPAPAAATSLLNAALGAHAARYVGAHPVSRAATPERIAEIGARAAAGAFDVVVVHGADPFAFSPLGRRLRVVPTVVSLSDRPDATTEAAGILLPDHAPLESWGIVDAGGGLESLVQPALAGTRDTRAAASTLAALADVVLDPADRIRRTWTDDEMRRGFRGALRPRPAPAPVRPPPPLRVEAPPAAPLLAAYPSPLLFDGRHEGNPFLEEIPDPRLSVAWRSVLEIHPDLAARHAIAEGDRVEVSTPEGAISLPARLRDGGHPDLVAVAMARRASNPLDLLSLDGMCRAGLAAAVSIRRLGPGSLPLLQGDEKQHGRGIAREAGDAAEEHGAPVAHAAPAAHAAHPEGPTPSLYPAPPRSERRWGMTIDLDRCTGCSACVAACYVENNVPIVGAEQVDRGREMAWIRIERYRTAGGVVSMPMLCQQCGRAPCEPVCPAYATYHSPEGLNVQVYNRCVGTRYCSNNCPYKVRRFNWFEFPPPAPGLRNPDVSVRGVGVMEKCTFCVQRIRLARIEAKNAGREIADGEVVPACAQTCPTGAILFGDLDDSSSRVARARTEAADAGRAYRVLEFLGVEPSITYLKRLRYA